MQGAISNFVFVAFNRSAKSCQSSQVKTTPKCGTGTSYPSTGFDILTALKSSF